MAVIEILQKLRAEAENLLGHLNSGSSRIYEITTSGSIIERTAQLREFHESIAQQIARVVDLLGAGEPRELE